MNLADLRTKFKEQPKKVDEAWRAGKVFEWLGADASCQACHMTMRNLNIDMLCSSCVAPDAARESKKPAIKAKMSGETYIERFPHNITRAPPIELIISGIHFPMSSPPRLLTHSVGHSKFYLVVRYGVHLYTRWGKIGTFGQENRQGFPDNASCRESKRTILTAKMAKGYSEVKFF